ncbi:prolipoprotein diacylglyceryl transferase [Oceanicoccus sp. KOV_DT_Chl]|uniref:prolipoprotein diacylglyceryl transferase n=1 Tax=Oceanicoccus sp. KOV_DT_Chl TaxID=1904639 RepID=UPI000C7A101F|nr:prolipoprotein diacylglyceryl transferase [Oceanicoccus sp. KOV_DT_Chl]
MLTHPDFDPVAVSLGPLSIHWYGLMYLLAFSAAWALAVRRAGFDYTPVKREQIDDLIFYGAIGVVLGGRFGYVMFYNFDKFLLDPLWLFKVWEGGMSFHGGFLGVMVAMIGYGRKINLRAGQILDFVVPIVPLGLGFGRLGNFIGQELWGRYADPAVVPWAMIFPADPSGLSRHPSQLYQAALEGLLLFLIVYGFSSRSRPTWSVSGVFMLAYGCFRFFVEFFRQPDSHIGFDAFGWLTRGQVLSLPMIVAGVLMIIYAYRFQAPPASAFQVETPSAATPEKKRQKKKSKSKR